MGRTRNGSTNGYSGKVKPKDLMTELGTSGLKQYGGRIAEEFLWQLRDRKGMETYKEMRENDPIVNAFFQAITMQIRGVEWNCAGAEGPDAEKADEYAESVRHDMSQTWEDVVSEIVEGMLTYGWQYLEIVYKTRNGPNEKKPEEDSAYDDGRLAWRKLQPVAQETLKRWVFDESEGSEKGSLLGLEQYGDLYNTGASGSATVTDDPFIPIEKSLLFRTITRKKNPEGRSILRGAYRPWFYKKRMEEVEGIGVERDLAGYPYIRPPEDMDIWDPSNPRMTQYRMWAEELVRGIRRDELEGAVLPHGWDLQLLSTGGDRQLNVGEIIERYDRRIATVPLADVIMLGHEAVGSYALADSKTNLLGVSLGAWLDMISAVFDRYAYPRLFRMSALRLTKLPELTHGDIETIDPAVFLDALQKAVAIGGVHLGPEDEVRLRTVLGLPEKTIEEVEEEAEEREAVAAEIAQTETPEGTPPGQAGEDGAGGSPPPGGGGGGGQPPGQSPNGSRGSSTTGAVEESGAEEAKGKAGTAAAAKKPATQKHLQGLHDQRDHGSWSMGSGGSSALIAGSPKSPNAPELADLDAVDRYRRSPRYAQFKSFAKQRAAAHGLTVEQTEEATGVYEGTVEPSLTMRVRDGATDIDAFANDLGERFEQESVLDFELDPNGPDTYYTLSGISDKKAALDAMSKHGIVGGSIVGNTLETVDFGDSAKDGLMAMSRELNLKPSAVAGSAAFHEKGTDYLAKVNGEQRIQKLQREWAAAGISLRVEAHPPNTHVLVFRGKVPSEEEQQKFPMQTPRGPRGR